VLSPLATTVAVQPVGVSPAAAIDPLELIGADVCTAPSVLPIILAPPPIATLPEPH
jgi:hypothetical protein